MHTTRFIPVEEYRGWPVRLLLLFLLLPVGSFAQEDKSGRVRPLVHIEPAAVKGNRECRRELTRALDTVFLPLHLPLTERRMAQHGYAEYSADSIRRLGRDITAWIYRGPGYYCDSILLSGLPPSALRASDVDKWNDRTLPFSRERTERTLAEILYGYQSKGYPFARFDSLRLIMRAHTADSLFITAEWEFSSGPLVHIDSIEIIGKIRERPRFIGSVTGLRPGDVYDQEKIDNIPRQLNNSIYYRNVKPAEVRFAGESARLIIRPEARKTGKFDLLLGILPPLKNEPRKVRFTGLADIQLVSPLFCAGEIIRLRYDKLMGTSQKINISYLHPWIAGTPLKAEGELNILKQDTLFTTRHFRFSGHYQMNPFLTLRAWYRNRNSSLISTAAYQLDTTRIPPVLDARDNTWGIGFSFDNLDYRFNPTRGFFIRLEGGYGKKVIRKNPRITDNIYAGLRMALPRTEAEWEFHWYQKLARRQVIHLANRSFWLKLDKYFQNDMLPLGGAQSIRGFAENQFFASFCTWFTAEYRYLLERNSFLFVFSDIAYMESPGLSPAKNLPIGIGAGMTYETQAGMLSITYAIGRTNEYAFQPSRGRIHIGLVNQF